MGRRRVGNFHRHHLARFIRSAIDRDDLVVVVDQHGGIDAGFEQRDSPERIARARVHANDAAVARRGIEHASSIQPGQHRQREGIIRRPIPGRRCPHQFAGLLVEGIKPVAARPVRAPVGGDAAGDDEVRFDQRRGGAAVGKSQSSVNLHHRHVPERVAIRGESGEDSLRALHINVARVRIHGRAGGGIAMIDRIAEEIAEAVPPQLVAGLGVKTGDYLLQFRALGDVTQDVKFAAGDDRSGLAWQIRCPQRLVQVNPVR